ncbi:MAG: urease accessory protein UreF [Rhodobacteraceae bacterium]|nr:urease accessory protein UreF [Paracoccaceae bacterium]
MTDPTAARIRLAQWLSPAFPVGGYAYSHGMEYAIGCGDIRSAEDFGVWLDGILRFGSGWNDAVLLGLCLRGGDAGRLGDLACALCAGRERWQETRAQGRAFLRAANALDGRDSSDLPLPVAVGVKARALDLPVPEVLGLYLHAFAGNLVSIATRAVPLGQTEAQQVLSSLVPLLAELAIGAAEAGEEDLASAALRADLHALCHETQDVRLFLT